MSDADQRAPFQDDDEMLQQAASIKPLYIPNWRSTSSAVKEGHVSYLELVETTPWEQRVEARQECFMSDPTRSYTYGKNGGERTYTSVLPSRIVAAFMSMVNEGEPVPGIPVSMSQWPARPPCSFNACFLNRYNNERQALGWHADDSPGQDHSHPIAVFSCGQPREIWWRPKGHTGPIPKEWRQLLEPGSLFIMPGGFQQTHEHRIPKGDRAMGTRISLTFRRFT